MIATELIGAGAALDVALVPAGIAALIVAVGRLVKEVSEAIVRLRRPE
jgi:hypothetical protein